jgi:hypothetical protein
MYYDEGVRKYPNKGQTLLLADHISEIIYIYIELGYDALQSTRTLCVLRSIINFKL